jgi:hypothetical protein
MVDLANINEVSGNMPVPFKENKKQVGPMVRPAPMENSLPPRQTSLSPMSAPLAIAPSPD